MAPIGDSIRDIIAKGDAQAALDLANQLIRSGRAQEAVPLLPLIIQALQSSPKIAADLILRLAEQGQAKAVLEALNSLGSGWLKKLSDILGEAGAKRLKDAVAKEVASGLGGFSEVLRKLARDALRFVGAIVRTGAKLLYQGAATLGRLAGLLVPRAVALLGPAGFGAALLALVLVLGLALYFLLSSPALEPYCDCTRVSAGLLTREYQEQCQSGEAQLQALTAGCWTDSCRREALQLEVGPDGTLVRGRFCDAVAYGPFAWPVEGGPVNPPPRPADEEACESVSGLSRECR